ncbi:MAG: hypothetical protein MJ252_26560 [archaeon]|nr:hypothetical protein [archaeon]
MNEYDSYTILDLNNIVKGARENSILGLYEKSKKKYDIALKIIRERMNELTDKTINSQWKAFEEKINSEKKTVEEILDVCETFEVINNDSSYKKAANIQNAGVTYLPGDQQVPDKDEANKKLLDNLNDIKSIGKLVGENMNKLESEKKSENKPENKVYAKWGLGNDKSESKETPNYGYNKPSNDRGGYNRESNDRGGYNKGNDYSGGGGYGRGGYSRENPMNQINNALNNYKPSQKMVDKYGYLANMGPNGNMGPAPGQRGYGGGSGGGKAAAKGAKGGKDSKDGKDQKASKSPFLEHCYPNGEGPDSELIEMLEREVVDTNPRITFDDIAELDKAKKVLKEAVLLPLIIPDYFKGIRRPWRGILLYGPVIIIY